MTRPAPYKTAQQCIFFIVPLTGSRGVLGIREDVQRGSAVEVDVGDAHAHAQRKSGAGSRAAATDLTRRERPSHAPQDIGCDTTEPRYPHTADHCISTDVVIPLMKLKKNLCSFVGNLCIFSKFEGLRVAQEPCTFPFWTLFR